MTHGHADTAPEPVIDSEADSRADPVADPLNDSTTQPIPVTMADDRPTFEDPEQDDDGSFRFGPRAALRPVPVSLPQRAARPGDHVPDTEADWLDTHGLCVRAVSVRGHSHRFLGEVRQDSFAIGLTDEHLVVAVSDGVGSAVNSHRGSAFLAHHAVGPRGIADAVLGAVENGAEADLSGLASLLIHEAARDGLAPDTVAATLIVALIGLEETDGDGREVVVAQIGDSTAWVTTADGWECLEDDPQSGSGPLSTDVLPMPHHTRATIRRHGLRRTETLALVSDGVGNILSANPSFGHELGVIWEKCAPTPSTLLSLVDATVKSYDDDRTFVGVRFG